MASAERGQPAAWGCAMMAIEGRVCLPASNISGAVHHLHWG